MSSDAQLTLDDMTTRRKVRKSPAKSITSANTAQSAARKAGGSGTRSAPADSPAEPRSGLGSGPGPGLKPAAGKGNGRPRKRRTAEAMAAQQREISVSEFFVKNRHLLGFDSPTRALLTAVKEAVDNALDACEEAGILPTLLVEVQAQAANRYRIAVQDNGPGIVKAQVPKIFGKLLYGSKFHRLKQSRGQQGIGISAAGMYGQLTTGKPVIITSRTGPRRPAQHFEIVINTRKNAPEVIRDIEVQWAVEHGTRVEIELEGTYKAGRRSVDEYLEQTAIANPHAEIFYRPAKGAALRHFNRVTDEMPPDPAEIKPHPHGVELGLLMKMLKDSRARNLRSALMQDFSRVTGRVADAICKEAGLKPTSRPGHIANREAEALYRAISEVKIMAPPTTCIVPIGEEILRRGLEQEIRNAAFYVCRTRQPKVYRGNPFLIEVGLAYGGQLTGLVDHGVRSDGGVWVAGVRLNSQTAVERALPALPGMTRKKAVELLLSAGVNRSTKVKDLASEHVDRIRAALDAVAKAEASSRSIQLVRLANRVPLQYQQAACSITKAVSEVNWKRYGLGQQRNSLPTGPMVLVVHIASVWVPFTSESKEAIAHYPEIIEEIQRALMDCGRELGAFLRRRTKDRLSQQRRNKLDLYCGELVESLHHLTGRPRVKIKKALDFAADRFAAVDAIQNGEDPNGLKNGRDLNGLDPNGDDHNGEDHN